MSAKQDRQGVRKATDLEQKYDFGKTFGEIRDSVQVVGKTAQEAKKTAVGAADEAKAARSEVLQLSDSITLSVTDGEPGHTAMIKLKVGDKEYTGQIDLQGLVTFTNLRTSGATEINGDNITTGTILADLIKAGVLRSANQQTYVDLNSGFIVCQSNDGTKRIQLSGGQLILDKNGTDWTLASLMHYSDTEETYFGMGGGTGHAFSVYASASGAYISLTHPEVGATGHTACWRKIFGIPMITTPDAKPALAPADIGAFPGFVRILTSADDMDDIKDDGIYVYSTSSVPANAPFANAAVVMVFGADSTTTQKIQLGIRYGEGGHFKFRALYSSSWHAWAEVLNSVNGPYELLWENASKTSSFAEQTISVDTSGYDHLLVVCSYNRSPATGQTTIPVWLRDKGDGDTSACLAVDYITSSGVITRPFRKMTVKAGRTQIVFGGGCKYDGTASDENAIPYYIYGLKGVMNP